MICESLIVTISSNYSDLLFFFLKKSIIILKLFASGRKESTHLFVQSE